MSYFIDVLEPRRLPYLWEDDVGMESLGIEARAEGDILRAFDAVCSNVKFDMRLVRDIHSFAVEFVNKNPDHVGFFGSGLLGVYPVRWLPEDSARWYDEILEVDENQLESAVDAVPAINPEFNVSSDPINLSTVWLLHGIHNSPAIPQAKKDACKVDIMSILHYKYITSLMAYYFPYGSDPEIALRVYESLNLKFDIRVYRTWGNFIEARARSIISPQGIHYSTYVRMNDDNAVIYMVSDIQNRIREVIKTLTETYYRVRAENGRIVATSSTVEIDGLSVLKDVKRAFSQYRRYLSRVIPDQNSFIRSELIEIISKTNNSMSVQSFMSTLSYMSANYGTPEGRRGVNLEQYVDAVLEYSFDFISSRSIQANDLSAVLEGIRGVINASRNSEREILYLRDMGDKLVRKATGKSRNTPVAGERTAVILYIVLRALTMNYYR